MVDGVRHSGFLVKQLPLEFFGIGAGLCLPFVVSSLKAAVTVFAFFNRVHCVLDNVFVDRPFVWECVTVVAEDVFVKDE